MALHDKPQVDSSAMNSGRSERKLNDWLNEDHSFILRKETPDKGCDFMCELLDVTGATNLKCPIQLKSIQTLTLVEGGKYISYPMLTSRLGYMLRFIPTTGIIVFFSVESEQLFYDFSDQVYERLMANRQGDEWIYQDQVNIWIPVGNILNTENIKILHQALTTRFERATKMHNANAEKYELPVVEIPGNSTFDFNNKNHLKRALKKFGLALLTRYDLAPVYNSLSQLTLHEIESDKDLLLLACVAYGETGRFYESDLFIRKLERNFDLSPEEQTMIEYASAKNLLQLGRLSSTEFISLLEKQKSENSDTNNIIIRINILRLKAMELDALTASPKSMTEELSAIFRAIEESAADSDTKDILTLWNAEQESHLLTHQLSQDFLSYNLSREVGKELSTGERQVSVHHFINSQIALFTKVQNIFKRAIVSSNKFLQASSLSLLVTHFIQKLFIFISQDIAFPFNEDETKKYFGFAMNGFQLFMEISMLKDAHYCLSNALEIMYAAKAFHQPSIEEDINNLLTQKSRLEAALMIEPFPSQIQILIEKSKQNATEDPGSSLKNLSDEQLLLMGRKLFEPFKLPEERFENMMDELRAMRMFYQRCSDDNVKFAVFNGTRLEDAYKAPVSYKLYNRLTRLESLSAYNMDVLLSSWGF
ncbi:MAG: DUF4365 domain-containing protein [Bacteroidota bacterium]